MPIYEFYCEDCHTIYQFFARRSTYARTPACPKCDRPELERQISLFAISKGRADEAKDDETDGGHEDELPLPPGFDEEKMMRVMSSLEREMERIDEDDPRQMAHLMRKLYDATGMPLGPGMQEAIRRMEAGEDPDTIEEELGEVLEHEGESLFPDAAGGEGASASASMRAAAKAAVHERLAALRRRLPPRRDPTLYEFEAASGSA